MTKKRIYQLGKTTPLYYPEACAIIKNRDKIVEEHGKEGWRYIYHRICNEIREVFEFPYLMVIDTYVDNDDYIAITIFEVEKDKVDECTRTYDKEKKINYIEIEEELLA